MRWTGRGSVKKRQPTSPKLLQALGTPKWRQLAKGKDYFKISKQLLNRKWWTACCFESDGPTPEAEAEATIDFLE